MDKAQHGSLILSSLAELLRGLGVSLLRDSGGRQGLPWEQILRVSKDGRNGQMLSSPTHLMCCSPWFPDSAVATHIAPSIPKEFSWRLGREKMETPQ